MSLSVDYIDAKRLCGNALKAYYVAEDLKSKGEKELCNIRNKYNEKINRLNKGNYQRNCLKKYKYLGKIRETESEHNIVCKELDKAGDILQKCRDILSALTETVYDCANVPRYCRNNTEIRIEPFDMLYVFFNKPDRRLYGIGHGHVTLNGDMVIYDRPIDAPHGRQNFIKNNNRSSVLASQ